MDLIILICQPDVKVELFLHTFFTLALDGGEWSASRSWRITPRERSTSTHYIGGWVDSRAGLNAVANKIPVPTGNRGMVIQHVAGHYTD